MATKRETENISLYVAVMHTILVLRSAMSIEKKRLASFLIILHNFAYCFLKKSYGALEPVFAFDL